MGFGKIYDGDVNDEKWNNGDIVSTSGDNVAARVCKVWAGFRKVYEACCQRELGFSDVF